MRSTGNQTHRQVSRCATNGYQSPPTPVHTMIANDQRADLVRQRATFQLPVHKFTRRKAPASERCAATLTSPSRSLRRPLLFATLFLFHFLSNQLVNTFQFLDDPGNFRFFFAFSKCFLNLFAGICSGVFFPRLNRDRLTDTSNITAVAATAASSASFF